MFDTRLQKLVVKSSKDGSCCDLPGASAAASAFDDDMVDRFADEDAKDCPSSWSLWRSSSPSIQPLANGRTDSHSSRINRKHTTSPFWSGRGRGEGG